MRGRDKRKITIAAIKSIAAGMKKEVKEKEGTDLDEKDLSSYLKSLMFVRTIPRHRVGIQKITVANISKMQLLDVSCHACCDSGSGTGISTCENDFVWVNKDPSSKASVEIRGPSIGVPTCGGRGALVFRCEIEGKPYGIVHPDGVLAESEMQFRVLSERVNKARGLRMVNGEYHSPDYLECVRSRKKIRMKTHDDILVLQTQGKAIEIKDSPEFRQVVEEIRQEKRSPLVDLTYYLENDVGQIPGDDKGSKLFNSCLHNIDMMSLENRLKERITSLVFNEAKATPIQQARLWLRRFAYCDSSLLPKMASMPEYGDFPKLPYLNEDSLVSDQAKFKRKPFKANDPSVTMDCPPWWRVYFDGYGGQGSLGGESYEGAVGSYIFVCCSTGSVDVRLYASHEQFPVALHQFLRRVEAEHFKVHVLYGDTFSANLSEDVEEVCALFKCSVLPISAGTPQELAFAESMVRTIKRMSTAMMLGAPQLPRESWACADKYAVFVHDFLPQSTRGGHCPFHLRTGRKVNWNILPLHVFGAPCVYAPIDGPIHKRAAVTSPGFFVGVQWPAVLIRRSQDNKIISCAKQKIKVYEKPYIAPLDEPLSEVGYETDQEESPSTINESTTEKTGQPARPELTKNMVQSVKSLREHQFALPGYKSGEETTIEESARINDFGEGGEGAYVDDVCNQHSYEELSQSIKKAIEAAKHHNDNPSIRQQVVSKLKAAMDMANHPAPQKGSLKRGKKKAKNNLSSDNIVTGKRVRFEEKEDEALSSIERKSEANETPRAQAGPSKVKAARGRKPGIKVGDLVSLPATSFDGENPGSFSNDHPEPCVGKVLEMKPNGLTRVKWLEDQDEHWVRVKDLTLEVRKRTIANIIVLLVEGEQVAFESREKHNYPKNFFELLVKADWRQWVEAVKKELTGWEANNAVSVVPIDQVPKSAKVVPLGELYSIKRDGRYKFRQYLMGNLLRDGIDFESTFSTTVSDSGICVFFSLATTCRKFVWGWDAICGYLQAKEQYDVYAFLPSHHGYSEMEYEELAVLRNEFVNLVKSEGEAGLKRFATKHRRESRTNPKEVYKLNSSIYGNAGAGHEFEMLIQAVHTQTCGCTQTEPEPSIYVRIVVDDEDKVTGYLIAAAYTDDIRFFGTEPERQKYMEDVASRLKVTFTKPPVTEFVSIETYQCLETNTFELKMPRYFEKAQQGFQSFFPDGIKKREVPITMRDEELMKVEPTPKEVEEAKHLPYRSLLGVLTYPASNCKFELKYAISICGARRGRWNMKQFQVVLRILEYAVYTKDIGLCYSKGLDPHGENTCYAYGDAGLQLPRSYGCRIVMLNGAAVSFKAKRQTTTAPSTVWAEMTTFHDTALDVAATRNLLAELGMFQEEASIIYGDNEAQQCL